jgi:hypothetical protein
MDREKNYKAWCLILAVLLIISWVKIRNLKENNQKLEIAVEDYSHALNEANDNIEEANSNIEDAQSYAWSDYEDMGNALESLSTVDTVSSP